MDEFWKWMRKKEYNDPQYEEYLLDTDDESISPTKQMLIGYMIEYLAEKNELTEIEFNYDMESVQEYFDRIKTIIENIK